MNCQVETSGCLSWHKGTHIFPSPDALSVAKWRKVAGTRPPPSHLKLLRLVDLELNPFAGIFWYNSNMVNLDKLNNFFSDTENLKTILRFGANNLIPRNLKDSSAEHSWNLTLLIYVLAKELDLKIDVEKCMKMALIHDLAESRSGDIDQRLIKQGKVFQTDKDKKEKEAIGNILENLSKKTKQEISSLYNEYNDRKTKEAKFVRAVGQLETTYHIMSLGYKYYDDPDLIAMYPDESVKNFPELLPILKLIKTALKKQSKRGKIPWKKEYNFGL
ncbi:MAG: HD domain-containing protein [Candidatus Berkelbacteria bacterium]|nr:HD domain-containing protein [Candidatus Berkelbacteria bacterium]